MKHFTLLLILLFSSCAVSTHRSVRLKGKRVPIKLGVLYKATDYVADSSGKNPVKLVAFLYTKSTDSMQVAGGRWSTSKVVSFYLESIDNNVYFYKRGRINCVVTLNKKGIVTHALIDGDNSPLPITSSTVEDINVMCCEHKPAHCCQNLDQAALLSYKYKCVW